MAMVNAKALFKSLLITDLEDDFYTLIGARISTPIPPPGWENETACMVYHVEDTTRQRHQSDKAVDFLCKFYGGDAAFSAAEAVFLAFEERVAIMDNPAAIFEIQGDWDGGVDPDLKYPVYMARVRVRFNN